MIRTAIHHLLHRQASANAGTQRHATSAAPRAPSHTGGRSAAHAPPPAPPRRPMFIPSAAYAPANVAQAAKRVALLGGGVAALSLAVYVGLPLLAPGQLVSGAAGASFVVASSWGVLVGAAICTLALAAWLLRWLIAASRPRPVAASVAAGAEAPPAAPDVHPRRKEQAKPAQLPHVRSHGMQTDPQEHERDRPFAPALLPGETAAFRVEDIGVQTESSDDAPATSSSPSEAESAGSCYLWDEEKDKLKEENEELREALRQREQEAQDAEKSYQEQNDRCAYDLQLQFKQEMDGVQAIVAKQQREIVKNDAQSKIQQQEMTHLLHENASLSAYRTACEDGEARRGEAVTRLQRKLESLQEKDAAQSAHNDALTAELSASRAKAETLQKALRKAEKSLQVQQSALEAEQHHSSVLAGEFQQLQRLSDRANKELRATSSTLNERNADAMRNEAFWLGFTTKAAAMVGEYEKAEDMAFKSDESYGKYLAEVKAGDARRLANVFCDLTSSMPRCTVYVHKDALEGGARKQACLQGEQVAVRTMHAIIERDYVHFQRMRLIAEGMKIPGLIATWSAGKNASEKFYSAKSSAVSAASSEASREPWPVAQAQASALAPPSIFSRRSRSTP